MPMYLDRPTSLSEGSRRPVYIVRPPKGVVGRMTVSRTSLENENSHQLLQVNCISQTIWQTYRDDRRPTDVVLIVVLERRIMVSPLYERGL